MATATGGAWRAGLAAAVVLTLAGMLPVEAAPRKKPPADATAADAAPSSASPSTAKTGPRAEWDELASQIARRAWFEKIAAQAFRRESLVLSTDRDPADIVLRRAAALLADVKTLPGCPDLSDAAAALAALETRRQGVSVSDAAARYALFEDACRVRRRIALANPLLDFDAILMVRRPKSGGVNHMCDQYFGWNAKPTDGGIFVLRGAFGAQPSLVNVLKDARVEGGRLAGRRLDRGGFLSPDLSFDAKHVAFAYTESGQGEPWSPTRSFHVFKANLDGTGLAQLTDGPCNDFDPCWLPSGRIALMSERRGGMCRCGSRPVPTYTLHAMNADGSNLVCLSYHETNEWHPSVDNAGMLVYSRWDYVDRDSDIAHHPWVCTPDGCDARAIHGNYPDERKSRPWMELNIRAIPNSHRYVATSAPHHGQAYGSLVVIDPTLADDGAMSQLRRLTPAEPFAESELKGDGPYATPWPLSETYYLAACRGAVVLLDAFGNRETLLDADGPWLDPIPVRPREGRVIPDRTTLFAGAPAEGVRSLKSPGLQTPTSDAMPAETITVLNVYESLRPWPEGVRIRALRVLQVLPKTTPNADDPKIGVGKQTGARAALGTVPVEEDGSAYFRAPINKAIYFQALDGEGRAVQSMRSLTYLHQGERLTCRGCHEPRTQTQAAPAAVPLALRRAPSELKPEPDGANPFNYVRLVQPVLDRHCAACHAKEPKAPKLDAGPAPGKHGFSISYTSLAAKYGFYFDSFNGSHKVPVRGGSGTTPGAFGAMASRLMQVVGGPAHAARGLKLPPEDLYRLTVWLDCNTDFYGAYENVAAQARGEVVRPALE